MAISESCAALSLPLQARFLTGLWKIVIYGHSNTKTGRYHDDSGLFFVAEQLGGGILVASRMRRGTLQIMRTANSATRVMGRTIRCCPPPK